MARIEESVYCDNCGVEITWAPYLTTRRKGSDGGGFHKVDYCCQECYKGYVCRCGERMEMEDERRSGTATLPSLSF
jgi:hypothetical protein